MKHIVLKFFFYGLLAFFSDVFAHRPSSYPLIAGDTFRAIADHIVDETNQPFAPENVKPYDIIFLKTDLVKEFFETLHPRISSKYILITHNSDFSPIFLTAHSHPWRGDSMEKYLSDTKLVVWFAQNIDVVHSKLKPLPIGVANSCWGHGNVQNFLQASKHIPLWSERSKKLYVNFSIANNPSQRQPAYDYFKTKSYAYFAHPQPPAHYLQEMKQYRYVINPPGNGLDCHRTWEALLLGCIPVMKHSLLDPMLDDLPVIFVDSWSEVTEEFLEQKYQEMLTKKYNREKVYADYWITCIKSYQQVE